MTNSAVIGNSKLLDLTFDLDGDEVGKLSSTNRIQLHTQQAKRLFNGHLSSNQRALAFGIKQVAYNMNMMMVSIRNNDPYGDYYFYEIELRLMESRERTKEVFNYYQERAQDNIPNGFASSKATSVNPTIIDIRSSNPLFFQMVFWLCEIDEFVSLISTLKHLGIMKPRESSDIIESELKAFRSLTHFIRSYQITGVTRDDFAANNARAAAAREKMKNIILPSNILSGELRSEYAPEIQKANNVEVVGVKNLAEDNSEPEQESKKPDTDTEENKSEAINGKGVMTDSEADKTPSLEHEQVQQDIVA